MEFNIRTQEDFLSAIIDRKNSIEEQIISQVAILDIKLLRRKNQDKKSQERLVKVLIDFKNVEYTLMLDAFKLSKDEVILYADADDALDLTIYPSRYLGDNEDFIDEIVKQSIEVNNNDIPDSHMESVVGEILFKINERIQNKIDEQLSMKEVS
jgi:hypothetical protein